MSAAHYATGLQLDQLQVNRNSCKGIASDPSCAKSRRTLCNWHTTTLDLIMRSLTGKRIAHVFIFLIWRHDVM
jgi:hypothetical protein